MFVWASSPESSPRGVLYSDEIPRPENGWSGKNVAGYGNPEADRLTDAIEIELDRERWRSGRNSRPYYAEDLPDLPLYFRTAAYVRPRWLASVCRTGHQFSSTPWVEGVAPRAGGSMTSLARALHACQLSKPPARAPRLQDARGSGDLRESPVARVVTVRRSRQ